VPVVVGGQRFSDRLSGQGNASPGRHHRQRSSRVSDDGTPICDTVIAELVSDAFIRVLIHDAQGRPVNTTTSPHSG